MSTVSKNILFVCTQNVFRSLSAQKLLEAYLCKKNIFDWNIWSAGTIASPDQPYSYTIRRLAQFGVRIDKHRQSRVSEAILCDQDVIICMTHAHKSFIQENYENYRHGLPENPRLYLFNEISYGKKTDLEDDIENKLFQSAEVSSLQQFVESTVDYIAEAIPKLFEGLERVFQNTNTRQP